MADNWAKMALVAYRHRRNFSTRALAQEYNTTVPAIHASAGCMNGENCIGRGCRLR